MVAHQLRHALGQQSKNARRRFTSRKRLGILFAGLSGRDNCLGVLNELDRSLDYLRQYTQLLADEGVSPEESTVGPLASLARTLFASNEFVTID